MNLFLDIFFTIFHTSLILFNLFGWIWKKTRRINLLTLLLTGLSWTFLGLFYGFGYCPFTDWHFMVLYKIGSKGLPSSYISFLIHRFTGIMPDEGIVDMATLIFFLVALGISVYTNLKRNKSQNK
ncbi:MAG: DUF2784 domain-containing protein [Bacteroidales bacterium]|nr:DUF2784 domain-containing protein [Bacteroidales bacterium]